MKKFTVRSFLKGYIRKHIKETIILVVSILMESSLVLAPSFFLKIIFDRYFDTAAEVGVSFLGITLLYFGSYLLSAMFSFLETYLVDRMGQEMIADLRRLMIQKTHKMKPGYFTKHGTGEMTSHIMDDVTAIETLFESGLVSILVSSLKIISITVSVFYFSWVLGLILLATVPLIFLLTELFRRKSKKAQLQVRTALNKESNMLSESIDTAVTVHNLGKRGYREGKFNEKLIDGDKAQNRTALFDSFYPPLIDLLQSLVIALVTFAVVKTMNLDSSSQIVGLTVGSFAASLNLIQDLFSPVKELGQDFQSLQEGFSGVSRVEEFLNEEEINGKDQTFTASYVLSRPNKPILQFDNLSFRYEDGTEYIFDHASFSLSSLDQASLTGRTGIGKTTLFKLILGLLPPTEGAILVNGVSTIQIPDEEKKKIFGYVEQGFSPVPGTVLDQVTLGDESISLDAVHKAMKEAFLDDYVSTRIKGGYHAPFKETDFSRGQLQLLGLARALVNSPSILLLDEISANLDSETEQEVIRALSAASSSRTVLSISHRLSDQLGFNKVLLVENGKITEKK